MDTPKQAQAIARKAALFLIEKEPQRPMGYRLLRALRWDLLDKAPPAENGKTQLPAPAQEQRTFFQNLVAKEDWQTALPAAEKAFASGSNHVWLDLQRIAATACSRLGDTYSGVRNAILQETAMFVKRVGDLGGLAFSDGSAFCDPATRDWLVAEAQRAGEAGELAASERKVFGDKADGALETEKREVNALVAAGKTEDALDYLNKLIRDSSSERDNFLRSMHLCSLLLTGKRPDIAVAILESLDEKIGTYHLEKWDPQLAVEAWALLLKAYKAAQISKPQNMQMAIEKQNTILQKLSRTDPRSAFRINM
jgi:type VI secretion system protein VasJ